MIQSAASIVAGVVLALVGSQGFQIGGLVVIAAGLARLGYGIFRYLKYS